MTQFQFEVICKIVRSGAPVLADELCDSLNDLVQDWIATSRECERLTEEINTIKSAKQGTDELMNVPGLE